MPDPSGRDNAAFVAHWKRIGPLLERIRREELRRFDYPKNWEAVDSLLEMGLRLAVPRTTSGLVEQQRWFRIARERSIAEKKE